MEIDPTTLVVLGVICVVLGFIASSLLGTLREDSESDQPVDTVDLAPPGGRKGRYTAVARLWRERQTDRLIVEIDGKSLVSSTALNPIQRERLEFVTRDLGSWLGIGTGNYSTAPEAPNAAGSDVVQPAAYSVITTYNAVMTASAEAQPGSPPASPKSITPPDAQSGSSHAPRSYAALVTPRSVAKPARGKTKNGEVTLLEEAAAQISASKSIVGQIEDILQDMLAGSPHTNRGIHLLEDPHRGVVVSLDANRYEGIESVPDPEIKALIKSAVTEWERHQ